MSMKFGFIVAVAFSIVLAVITSVWVMPAFSGVTTLTVTIGNLVLHADAISAGMTLLINTGVILGALYGVLYLAPYKNKSGTEVFIHAASFFALHISMLFVVYMRDVVSLLIWWEVMSVSSFFLVLFDGHRAKVREAAISYIVQMHVGAACILAGGSVLFATTGSWEFSAIQTLAVGSEAWWWVFGLMITGFSMKAGLVPLHSWLPNAHPAAPSHVSGVMSGVMIKLGIYGIVRMLWLSNSPSESLGMVLLVAGAVTAVYGILKATVQTDLKRLLAYSSIENMGLLVMSIGMAEVATALNSPVVAAFAWCAVVLHAVVHMLAKTMLFQGAGNIYAATHSRNLNDLGGLVHRMPKTVLLITVSGIVICGLPPFGAFASEFLMYSAGIRGMWIENVSSSIVYLAAVVAMCVAGGLAIIAFTKAIGIGLLGTARTPQALHAEERSKLMLMPQYLALIFVVAIAVYPQGIVDATYGVLSNLSGGLDLTGARASLVNIGQVNIALLLGTTIVFGLRRIARSNTIIERGPTWGCGFTAGDSRVQYTATTYGDSINEIAGGKIGIVHDYHALNSEDVFPRTRWYTSHEVDIVELSVVKKITHAISRGIQRIAIVQTGSIRAYISYAFVFILGIALLTVMGAL